MKSGKMNRQIGWWSTGCALGVGIVMVLLSGCGQNLEENPTIVELTKRMEDVEFQLVDADLEALYDDVEFLKQNTQQLRDANAQLAMIKDRLTKMEKDLVVVKADVEKMKQVQPRRPEVAAEKKPAEKKPPAKPEALKETYAKPKGFYYTIQKDDTLGSIAKKYDVSTGELLLKNRLPAGVTLYPGQQIFIPKAPQ